MQYTSRWVLVLVVGLWHVGGCTNRPAELEHSTATTKVTDKNFAAVVLNSDQPVVVDFWATWCGPCLEIAPAVEAVATQFAGRAVVAKGNVDECTRVSNEYQISDIPAILFFHRGEKVDAIVGSRDDMQQQIATRLEALLADQTESPPGPTSNR